ncbi:MAG: TRAP transporter TatT component family protein [Acidobacteria bacterium]|nr:TRAP transporter TatT component family protein [Acidobacteriota bacterium]
MTFRHPMWVRSVLFLLLLSSSCSLKQRAVNTLYDVLAESEKSYLSDEDPELIAAAMPFNLKIIETLLETSPEHRGLLLSATTGFTFYAYGFVEPEAQVIEEQDFDGAEQIRDRASRLYSRAFHYGFRGLEVEHPGFADRVRREPENTVAVLELEDVPLAVWSAAALGAAISVSVDNPELTADLSVVGALLHRALELEEDFQEGTIYEFLISYEMSRVGGSVEKAREYYRRAQELSGERKCSTWLTWAESVSILQQNRQEFENLMEKILSFDVSSYPENRLLNILAQRRARLLMQQIDDFFLE